jgi:hypothetical protein
MEEQKFKMMEIPAPLEDKEGEGFCIAGMYGETTPEAMEDRRKRSERFRQRTDFRECIPCEKCWSYVEMRGFRTDGKEYIKGGFCLSGDIEVEQWNTCNSAKRRNHGYRRIVYDMENAPLSFKMLAETGIDVSKPPETVEATFPKFGYRGGSEMYKRVDRDKEAIGTGKVPKGLAN